MNSIYSIIGYIYIYKLNKSFRDKKDNIKRIYV